MKVILQQDVKSLGKKGDTVEVNDGYARNYILPKKLGVEANSQNINTLKLQRANEEKVAREQLKAAQELAAVMETKKVIVRMKAGEGGRVFGSISSKEIAAEAQRQCGLALDKKKIQLPEPIKSFGTFEVSVKLHPQVSGKLSVIVQEER